MGDLLTSHAGGISIRICAWPWPIDSDDERGVAKFRLLKFLVWQAGLLADFPLSVWGISPHAHVESTRGPTHFC